MGDKRFHLYGRTQEAVIDDAVAKGLRGHLVMLQWPPLHDTEAWERLNTLESDRATTFAVRVFPDAQQTTKAYEEYLERYFRFVDNAVDYDQTQTIHGLSATSRTCKTCASHVSVEYVRGEACPVCGADLRSNTVHKTLERWTQRIAKVREQGEGEAIKAGWLGSWAALAVEGHVLEGGPTEAKRLLLRRRYDSVTANLNAHTSDEVLLLPQDTARMLAARADAAGLTPAAYLETLLAAAE